MSTNVSGYNVKFLGEAAYATNRTNPDTDFDNATDGQEVYGYRVTISWFEGDELKSMNKTIYGHPWGAYKEPDNTTYLDVDEDGITDIDEIDPWNSTTPAVMEFIEHFKDDQEMLDGQFNRIIRESTPPVVINVKVKTREDKEYVCFLLCYWQTKRTYAEIDIEAIDVAKFFVTVKISPGRLAEFEGEGHEWFKAQLDLLFWEIAGKYKVKIEMVDFAGNELDPPYEEEVYGWFGGVLRMLEALWEFICAVVSAIADAVMAAVSFIIDLLVAIFTSIVETLLAPIIDAYDEWTNNIIVGIKNVMWPHSDGWIVENTIPGVGSIYDLIFSGAFFYLIVALYIGYSVAGLFVKAAFPGTSEAAESLVNVAMKTILRILFSVLIVPALLTGGLIINQLFLALYPEGDQFWAEGVGLSIMSLAVGILSYTLNKWAIEAGIWIDEGSDAAGLVLAFVALFLQAFSPLSGSVFDPLGGAWVGIGPVLFSFLGVVFSMIAIDMTTNTNDFTDTTIFGNIEEVLSVIAFAYSGLSFARDSYNYLSMH